MSLPLLMQAQQLADVLNKQNTDYLIIDVCSAETYAKHHIPGAVHIAPQALQRGQPPTPGKIPDEQALTALFSNIGLRPNQHVITYDDEGGGWAGRLIWTLDAIGHHQYSYLDGGIHSWVSEGLATETAPAQPAPSDYRVTINLEPIAEIDDIMAKLDDSDFAIWDARSAQEYDGSKVLAKHGGHIPGAVNIDWLDLIDKDRNFRLVDLDRLQERLNKLGLSKEKDIVTHCQTHHRSGLTYLAMKILGYPRIRGYHGSWSEWGNLDDTPKDNPAINTAS